MGSERSNDKKANSVAVSEADLLSVCLYIYDTYQYIFICDTESIDM